MIRRALIFLTCLALASCATPSHNPAGGYIDACGDLPGLLGDDC